MAAIRRAHIDTPLGPMLALATERGLCALEFHRGERLTRLEQRLARWFAPGAVADGTSPFIDGVRAWLAGYFDGTNSDTADLQLDMRGAPFERRVWDALRTIPAGTTVSYGHIARQLGDPHASRAVGMANGANPIAIVVPCHRVVGANGTLVGYGGGLDKKTWLIEHERRWRTDRLF